MRRRTDSGLISVIFEKEAILSWEIIFSCLAADKAQQHQVGDQLRVQTHFEASG